MYNEAQADAASSEPVAPSGSDGGPGAWKGVKRGGSKASRDFQRKVSGTPEGPDGELYEYEVNGVHFDGFDAGPPPTLLEAKGERYDYLLKSHFAGANIRTGFRDELLRQLEAAGSTPVTWIFAEDGAAAAFTQLLRSIGLPRAVRVIVEHP